jgi:hypothetical protein
LGLHGPTVSTLGQIENDARASRAGPGGTAACGVDG